MSGRGAQLFSFRTVPAIAGMLVKRGVDPAQLLREIGLPLEAMQGEVTAPITRIRDLVERAAVLLARPTLGLDLVALVPTGTFGLAEFVGRFAPTVKSGFQMFCASVPLVNPMIEWRYIDGKTECVMDLSVPGSRDGLGIQLNEYSVAIVLRLANGGLDEPLRVTRAWFAHQRNAEQAAGSASASLARSPSGKRRRASRSRTTRPRARRRWRTRRCSSFTSRRRGRASRRSASTT